MRPERRLTLSVAAALALAACSGADRLPPQPTAGVVEMPYLADLFRDGAALPAGPETITIRTLAAGDLALPTGQVVVADAFAGADTAPLAEHVAPGTYPVTLSLATYAGSPYETVAAARLTFAPGQPVSWRLAVRPGQDAADLEEGEFYGYPVDSGTAMFASPEGARLFGQRLMRFGVLDFERLTEVSRAMEANAPNGGAWLNLPLDPAQGTNAVLFQSGFGDGAYAAYWGYDAAGALVCLVTDFDLAYADEDTP